MFSSHQLTGLSLPEKTLCLTFDDGPGVTKGDQPGPKTLRLAEYLHEQGISGTFFMVGKFIEKHPLLMSKVAKLGHIVGNHTYSHPDMLGLFAKGGDIITEIKRTDQLITGKPTGNTVFFRAPFGNWSPEMSDTLNVALNNDCNYTGPFYWDVDAKDWAFWQKGRSAEECARAYLKEIMRIDRGIVLMHDSTADSIQMRRNNLTFEMIRILIPRLKRLGYRFAGLNEITDDHKTTPI
jgi:peptidoglycan/xylan/chitin deacetylase (PgdA/CDA1 family)